MAGEPKTKSKALKIIFIILLILFVIFFFFSTIMVAVGSIINTILDLSYSAIPGAEPGSSIRMVVNIILAIIGIFIIWIFIKIVWRLLFGRREKW